MLTGTTALLVGLAVLVLLGVTHRVLDRMRLSKGAALALLGLMIAGTFLPELPLGAGVRVDPGGALVPAAVAIYLLLTADHAFERRRALVASLWTAAAVYATDWFLPSDPGGGRWWLMDPLWTPVAVAGLFGYLAGRSRRAAFIAATLGVLLVDLIGAVTNSLRGIPGAWMNLGGGGVFDAVVLAGVGAVALAELVGESREWLTRRAPWRRGKAQPALPPSVAEQPTAPSVAASWLLAGLALGVVGVTAWLGPRFQNPTGDELFDTHMELREIGTERLLLASARVMAIGDIWIDTADRWYRIVRVEGHTAYARALLQPADGTLAGRTGAYRTRTGRTRAGGTLAGPTGPEAERPGTGGDAAAAHPAGAQLASVVPPPLPGLFSAWRLAPPGLVPDPWGAIGGDGDLPPAGAADPLGRWGPGPRPGPASLAAALPLGAWFQKVVDPAPVRPTPRGQGFIGIYHTHNDESYIPTDGTASVDGRGGIHRVGDVLGRELAQHGFRVVKSEALHLPHDRGAYRRSRRTALKMIPKNPLVLLDVHRDATPPEFYREVVKGQPVTQIRLVVGRENPFRRTNLAFARRLKAEADRSFPGLVKGIYYGRGNYNQDLGPRTLLIEVGAHTNSRIRAERGAAIFATVLDRTLARR
ncbi:stage II sporulation protein P [Thermaerobacter marianensis DSM 12885]|uniref:Stage II sporulation protein P n=1 Tax=Thermaerobacter marianensis (strain ATCC 700841 / DSM 12885 / JCM 10246 / 7p75a) TaxID=644966 RepID=E6SJI5_THEM7|nr:stage II sporulation protein P [Thermaerobacter marianensis]ADU52140.1 stage II sporulation protein P [Thermaerobacter marianensis DSM 12885]